MEASELAFSPSSLTIIYLVLSVIWYFDPVGYNVLTGYSFNWPLYGSENATSNTDVWTHNLTFQTTVFVLNLLLLGIWLGTKSSIQLHVETSCNCRDSTETVKAYLTKYCPWLWLSTDQFGSFIVWPWKRTVCSAPSHGQVILALSRCCADLLFVYYIKNQLRHFYGVLPKSQPPSCSRSVSLEQEKNI